MWSCRQYIESENNPPCVMIDRAPIIRTGIPEPLIGDRKLNRKSSREDNG